MRSPITKLVPLFTTLVALSVGALCASGAQAAQTGQITGTITAVGAGEFTLQTPGHAVGVLNAMTQAATRIMDQNLPYVWGGGHGEAGVASRGERGGPGFNGKRVGYDCSGAVAAVLSAGGLWPQGSGVPNDAGVIHYLLSRGLIAPGAGVGPTEVTLYDNPGVHIFMNIDGRFWGTSDGGAGGDAKGGAGWLDDGAWDVTSKHFRRYHVVASALKAQTTAGLSMTFYSGASTALVAGAGVGTKVRVNYATSKYGTMVANEVTYTEHSSTSGAVIGVGAGNSSFTIRDADGSIVTFLVTPGSSVQRQLLSAQIALNAVVTVSYAGTAVVGSSGTPGSATQTFTANSVTVNAPPPPVTTTTTTTPTPTTTTPTTTTPTTTTPTTTPAW